MGKLYSLNAEDFLYEDVNDALQAMDDESDLKVGRSYYDCDTEPVSLTNYLNASVVLDDAADAAYNDLGECAEDAFSVSGVAVSELDELLSAWIAKHIAGEYWRFVGAITEHCVTADDVAEFTKGKP